MLVAAVLAGMARDIPTRNKRTKERGVKANDGRDPTLASYLSSLFYALSVPAFVGIAYAGHWWGYYEESGVVPVFAGLLIGAIVVASAVIYLRG